MDGSPQDETLVINPGTLCGSRPHLFSWEVIWWREHLSTMWGTEHWQGQSEQHRSRTQENQREWRQGSQHPEGPKVDSFATSGYSSWVSFSQPFLLSFLFLTHIELMLAYKSLHPLSLCLESTLQISINLGHFHNLGLSSKVISSESSSLTWRKFFLVCRHHFCHNLIMVPQCHSALLHHKQTNTHM